MTKLATELRREIVEIFENSSVEVHSDEASERFLRGYPQMIDLQEFLEFANADLAAWLEIPEKLLDLLNVHTTIIVNLGEALNAMHIPLRSPENQLACSPSIGVRVVTALVSQNPATLKLTALDPCYLVRLASYENKNSSRPDMEYNMKDDVFFRDFSIQDIDEMGEDYEELATLESCNCTPDDVNDFIHDKYNEALLELPPIAREFEKRLRYFGGLNFGTQPLPGPTEDYLFLDIVDYLQGPIPDQYVVSHAGHGVNSYSLNFRYALGDLAVLMQVAYGGAYGDLEKDGKHWDDCAEQIGDVMLLNPEDRKDGLWQRKYLLLYSNFRFEKHLRLLELRDRVWVELTAVNSWEDVKEFFSIWNDSD